MMIIYHNWTQGGPRYHGSVLDRVNACTVQPCGACRPFPLPLLEASCHHQVQNVRLVCFIWLISTGLVAIGTS